MGAQVRTEFGAAVASFISCVCNNVMHSSCAASARPRSTHPGELRYRKLCAENSDEHTRVFSQLVHTNWHVIEVVIILEREHGDVFHTLHISAH